MRNNILLKPVFYLAVLLSGLLTGCLEKGLENLPAFEDAKIVNIFAEYRFKDASVKNADGSPKVIFVNLPVTRTFKLKEETPGAATDSVLLEVTVPQPSGSFTAEVRNQVSAQNLVVYGNISSAAEIAPLSGAPVFGSPGDFSSPRQYQVTAADKLKTRVWTVKINKFIK